MIIINGKLITWLPEDEILEGLAILVSGDRIQKIGPQAELLAQNPLEERLDAHGQFVMPGNICAHTHFYGAFARGLASPGSAPKDFPEILEKIWWPLDRALRNEDIQYSALVMLVDAVRHGTTTLIDHHASPNAIPDSLDMIAEAVDQSGLRAVLCYEVTDRGGKNQAKAGIDENVRFLRRVAAEQPAEGRLGASFGLHASLTLSDATLAACREAAPEGCGFHLHVAEHPVDEYDCLEKTGTRVVDRLQSYGLLGDKSIAVHAVHIDAREIQLLADSGTWVTHQPRSNMNNAVGVSDVESYMRAGINVCLGTDGFSSTMWTEWKTAYLLQKIWNKDPRRFPGDQVVQMAVHNNARLAGKFFPDGEIGVLKEGAFADLILVDYHPITPLSVGNLPWHILFGFHESMITTTMVAGRILMKDRVLLTLDEEQIAARARELAEQVWKRYRAQF